MSSLQEHNLDYLAARHAQELVKNIPGDAKDAENTFTKTLGVLQENGVYACFLYLYAREKKGAAIADEMLTLLRALDFPALPQGSSGKEDVLKYVAEQVAGNLHSLLLAKEALEQMLIYARYGAKARQKE